ncbi:uncharacterized protein JN550_006567 [Neoarthrinium moseri]|uniref:uncharacterized protein n=1 Tax=Neoarthrinium moseri TaxID=1658444 RepID=UPI001FDDC5EE|nr:uncharacterized protein JN550_006567 [Neoarthrinium moseri]KAI1868079.1 hypothetical protein JN550_006567 [Neoarthrinium moseri]
MAPKRKRQARLHFEPTGAESSPDQRFSPAKVRFSQSSQIRSSPSLPKSASRPLAPQKTQKTLQDSLVQMPPVRKHSGGSSSASRPAIPSFLPRSQRAAVDIDSSDEEVADEGTIQRGEGSDDGDVDLLPIASLAPPPTSSQSVSTRLRHTVISDGEDENGNEDEDDLPIAPSSSRRRQQPAPSDDEDDIPIAPSSSRRRRTQAVDEDEDEDELPIAPSSSRRRRTEIVELDSDSDSDLDVSPAKKRKVTHRRSTSSPAEPAAQRLVRRGQPPSSPTKPVKGHRTQKQKNMELLRRRRAGEKIDRLTSSESEGEDDKRGLYDSDSNDDLQALEEFPDEEEEDEVVEEDAPTRKSKKKKSSPKKAPKQKDAADNSDDDLEDFVVEDDEGLLGAPANLDIPLEFTAQAHKPLKEQFPYVVEWLVHNRINPAFDRRDAIYTNAWRKLDDEVRGLATSKFTSSAWKVEFYRTLKARPKLEAYEMDRGSGDIYDTCEACGRSGHPATWKIIFQGQPYYKDTLEEVESDSDDSDASSGNESVDTQGNPLPAESKEWAVGSVCCSNAETAHSLMHWKAALKEWVEDRLQSDGHMTAKKIEKRDKMKAKKRRAAAYEIVDQWTSDRIIDQLYSEFKGVLKNARDKSTTGGRGQRWR